MSEEMGTVPAEAAGSPAQLIPIKTGPEENSEPNSVTEGKCTVHLKAEMRTFYNPAQEINRDVSVLGIHTNISFTPPGKKGRPASVTILEAMAASGIRSIRYAKEIPELSKVVANDISEKSVELIKQNCALNDVTSIVEPHLSDACALMHSQQNSHFVVDIDPYGTPVPFLDAAINCVTNGGMLLVTATDVAILAGNTPETCFAKYGSMSLKSEACHEMALRIIIYTVQSLANKYGRYVVPLLSLKIDFYVRLFFRVFKGPEVCKKSASQTSMVFQCTSCHSLTYQPIGSQKPNGKFGFSMLAPDTGRCSHCHSKQHIGGPMWTGPIHDKEFVAAMLANLKKDYSYLGTYYRIEGMLTLVLEEVDALMYYNISKLCAFLRAPTIAILKIRSALMNLGYAVSCSHAVPNTLKTNAPNEVLWDILRAWSFECNPTLDARLQDAAKILLAKPKDEWTPGIDFNVRPDANPASREAGISRYQLKLGFGPGVRSTFALPSDNPRAEEVTHRKKRKRKHSV